MANDTYIIKEMPSLEEAESKPINEIKFAEPFKELEMLTSTPVPAEKSHEELTYNQTHKKNEAKAPSANEPTQLGKSETSVLSKKPQVSFSRNLLVEDHKLLEPTFSIESSARQNDQRCLNVNLDFKETSKRFQKRL